MAEIELRIVAVDVDDLRETLARLLGEQNLGEQDGAVIYEVRAEDPKTYQEVQIAEAGEPAATTRRRRRTSAEIAADNAAAQSGPVTAAATVASSTSAPTTAKAPDPFGDQIKQVAAETKAEEAAAAVDPTSDDIQAAALAFSMAKSMIEAQKVLMSFTAENGDPVKTIKQVQPKDYAAVLAALQV